MKLEKILKFNKKNGIFETIVAPTSGVRTVTKNTYL
jgi:hypothetical protein